MNIEEDLCETIDQKVICYDSGYSQVKLKSQLKLLLSSISVRQRQAIEMIWIEGISRPKVAEIMGITENALRSYEAKGKMRLQELAKQFGYKNFTKK